jgi:hypothetical protein
VKILLSIFFVGIYLVGSMQTTWVLTDFYWNRDDYTQKYCINLDAGITQCRASCYLERALNEADKNGSNAELVKTEKIRITEFKVDQLLNFEHGEFLERLHFSLYGNTYKFEFAEFIFHPPKI